MAGRRRGRGGILLTVVPPGTWPEGLLELTPKARNDAITAALEDAHEAGLVLHATVQLIEEHPDPADRDRW